MNIPSLVFAKTLVLFRNANYLVLNKPQGWACHPGRGQAPSLTPLLKHLTFGLKWTPQLAHRLDKDTTGCLLFGRHPKVLRQLGHQFEKGLIEKTYLAVVVGCPDLSQGLIDLPLAKQNEDSRSWWMKVDGGGQPSQTLYKVLKTHENLSLLELKPLTGRTHQLRVHCAAHGFPILGDPIYGTPLHDQGLCLHAFELKIPQSATKTLTVQAPLPDRWPLSIAMTNYA